MGTHVLTLYKEISINFAIIFKYNIKNCRELRLNKIKLNLKQISFDYIPGLMLDAVCPTRLGEAKG